MCLLGNVECLELYLFALDCIFLRHMYGRVLCYQTATSQDSVTALFIFPTHQLMTDPYNAFVFDCGKSRCSLVYCDVVVECAG